MYYNSFLYKSQVSWPKAVSLDRTVPWSGYSVKPLFKTERLGRRKDTFVKMNRACGRDINLMLQEDLQAVAVDWRSERDQIKAYVE